MNQPEVRIFTVPQELADDTIRLRQAFGWSIMSTSARSFATHADAAFAGATAGNLFGGGSRMSFHNAHLVDLTMQRLLTPRSHQLAQLDRQYEAAEFRPLPRLGWNLAGWLLVGYLVAVLVAVVALEKAPAAVSWGVGITIGSGMTILLVLGWRRNRKRVIWQNDKARAIRQSILQRIGAIGAMRP